MVKKSRSSKRRTKQVKDYEYNIDAYIGPGIADNIPMQDLVDYLRRRSRVRIHDDSSKYPEIPDTFCGEENMGLVSDANDELWYGQILFLVEVEQFGIGAFLLLKCKSNFDFYIEIVCTNQTKTTPVGFSFAESADILIRVLMDFIDTRKDAELTLESFPEAEVAYLKKGFNYYDLNFDVDELIFMGGDLKMHYGKRYSNKINPFGEIIKSLKARRGGEDVKKALEEIEGIAKVEKTIRRLRTHRGRSKK